MPPSLAPFRVSRLSTAFPDISFREILAQLHTVDCTVAVFIVVIPEAILLVDFKIALMITAIPIFDV